MTAPRKKQTQHGLTLVELMIALLIGTILMAGLISLFLTTRQIQDTRNQLNQVANNARFFTEFIAHDIRMAGYQPGDPDDPDDPKCEVAKPYLVYVKSKKTLTIRYCDPAEKKVKEIAYTFKKDSNGEDVVYYKSPTYPLLNGIALKSIWFGEEEDGNLRFREDEVPESSIVRMVRIVFQLAGDVDPNNATATDPIEPIFHFTVAIRNNTLEPLQITPSAAK